MDGLLDLDIAPLPDTPHDPRAAIWLREEAEEWYIRERLRFRDSCLLLEAVVLKPLCWDCEYRLGARAPKAPKEITIVLPAKTAPRQFRIYDRSNSQLHIWASNQPAPEWWSGFTCDSCFQTFEPEDCDGIVPVTETPFAEYFGLVQPLDAPKTLRGGAKRKMQARLFELYGARCFECRKKLKLGKSLTLDHIEPKSRGGRAVATNLQPFCDDCQQKKKNLPAEIVVVALDMLLRPPPSDSHEGQIW